MEKLIFTILMLFFILGCGPKNYLNETIEEKEQRLEWWKDAKFGMFIHWGAYSVPAGWYKEEMIPGASEWLMYFANINPDEYEAYPKQFNPVQYNPGKWVKMAKQAGMKYIVITSKHHDGFCIWDSKITNYDIVDFSPYNKDLLKPLYDACLKEGIKLGFYHSIMDWHHPDAVGENFPKYRDQYLIPQLEELLTEFPEISILWFDGEWIDEWTEDQGKSLYNHLRNIKPNLIINNRIGKGRDGMQGMSREENSAGDFGTPEQEILETSSSFPWESCMTMNDSWGYKRGDENWKSAETIIYNLIDITSKGGNYLLNVGPDSKGNIPKPSIVRLEKIGRWTSKNAEGIYNTRPIKNYAEGENIRYTKSKDGKYYYAFILNQTEEIYFSYISPNKNSEIILVGDGQKIKYQYDGIQTFVKIPADIKFDEYPVCLRVEGIEHEVAKQPRIMVNGEKVAETFLFQNSVKINIVTDENAEIFYSIDESIPSKRSEKFTSEINLTNSATIKAVSLKEGLITSPISSAKFYKIQSVKNLELKNQPSEKYSAKGKLSLVDGIRGTTNFSKDWLGFEGDDFEAIIDLGKIIKVNNVYLGSLSVLNSWIFLPKKVTFYISNDKINFSKVSSFEYEVAKDEKPGGFIKDIPAKINSNIRYLKISAENIKQCPDWHKGSNGKAWLFVDEIIID